MRDNEVESATLPRSNSARASGCTLPLSCLTSESLMDARIRSCGITWAREIAARNRREAKAAIRSRETRRQLQVIILPIAFPHTRRSGQRFRIRFAGNDAARRCSEAQWKHRTFGRRANLGTTALDVEVDLRGQGRARAHPKRLAPIKVTTASDLASKCAKF